MHRDWNEDMALGLARSVYVAAFITASMATMGGIGGLWAITDYVDHTHYWTQPKNEENVFSFSLKPLTFECNSFLQKDDTEWTNKDILALSETNFDKGAYGLGASFKRASTLTLKDAHAVITTYDDGFPRVDGNICELPVSEKFVDVNIVSAPVPKLLTKVWSFNSYDDICLQVDPEGKVTHIRSDNERGNYRRLADFANQCWNVENLSQTKGWFRVKLPKALNIGKTI
jgi:hypothetical protein